jgi:tetratricopeptide (TPR) repeat protein
VQTFLTEHVLAGATPERIPDKTLRDTIVGAMLDPAAAASETAFTDQPLVSAAVHVTLAECYNAIGRADLALPHARKSLELRARLLGDTHPDTIRSLTTVGSTYLELGKFDDAERTLTDTLARAVLGHGEDHELALRAAGDLGSILALQDRAAEAEPLLQRHLMQVRRSGGPEQILGALDSLAQTLLRQNKLDEAEPLLREALEQSRQHLTDQHPRTIGAMNTLAEVLRQQSKFAEARPMFEAALAKSRSVLGEDHMTTLVIYNNLGTLLNFTGERAEATRFYRKVADSMLRLFGDEHPNTATAMHKLGTLLAQDGEFAEAEPLLRRALEGRRRSLPPNHAYVLHSVASLADMLITQERFDQAEPLLAELFQKCPQSEIDAALGARYMAKWGPCLVTLGRHEQADAPLREAYRRLVETNQAQSTAMARVLSALAKVCDHTYRLDDAARWRTELNSIKPTTAPQ